MSSAVMQRAGWVSLMDTLDSQGEIRNGALRVVKSIQAVLASDQFAHRVDLSFSISEERPPIIATFSSPLGAGRLRFEWAVGADGLVGVIVVDGERRDKYDVTYFEPVMTVVFPQYDEPHYVADGEKNVLKLRSYTEDRRDSLLALGMSMLHATMIGLD